MSMKWMALGLIVVGVLLFLKSISRNVGLENLPWVVIGVALGSGMVVGGLGLAIYLVMS